MENILNHEEYKIVFNKLVHFSFGLSNSNVKGGIRLEHSMTKNLPYASVTTAMANGITIKTDYFGNAATHSKPFSHLNKAMDEVTLDEVIDAENKVEKNISPEPESENKKSKADDLNSLRKRAKNLRERYENFRQFSKVKGVYERSDKKHALYGGCSVNPRLPQLLVKKENKYVSLTPLSSAGYGLIIQEAYKKTGSSLTKAIRSIGGKNTQNIGGLVHSLRSVVVVDAPKPSKDLQKAYAILYKGIQYDVPEDIYSKYFEWRKRILANKISFDHNLYIKRKEISFIIKLVKKFKFKLHKEQLFFDLVKNDLPKHPEDLKPYNKAILKYLYRIPLNREEILIIGKMLALNIFNFELFNPNNAGKKISWNEHDIKKFSKIIGDYICE